MKDRFSTPAKPRDFGFFIDGEWRHGRELYERFSPSHEQSVTRTACCTQQDLDDAVAAARKAFEEGPWAWQSGADRADVLLRAAALMREQAEEIAYWEVLENGKPFTQAKGEIAHAIACFETAAGAARLLHGHTFNNLGRSLFGMVLRAFLEIHG
nr:aldehyde dehydrogenase family protein [Acetobacter malorum]